MKKIALKKWFFWFFSITSLVLFILNIYFGESLTRIILSWIVFVLFLINLFSLKLEIDGEKLVLSYYFKKFFFNINNISKVRNIKKFTFKNDFSFSWKWKIKIYFWENEEDYIILAPKNKQKFLEDLRDVNSQIDFDL